METTKQKTSATIARATTPPLHVQRAAASVRPPSVRVSAPVVQPSLRVSSPADPAEKEAESTARSVVRMSIPDRAIGFVRTAAGGVFRQIKGKKEDEDRDKLKLGPKPLKVARLGLPGEIQRKAEGMPNLKANVAAEIQSASAGGNPLPLTVRRFMEPRFKADFSAVKVHTGDRAAKLNQQLNAKAFAVGKNVFFGKDQFKPETDEGRELIAHELTHTIQQGAATQGAPVRRSADVTVTQSSPVQVQRLGVSDALDYFADKANLIPGYRMFTIVLGVNPVNMSRVDRSPANIMRAIIEFIPGGGLITQALDNYGVFDKVGAWVDQQLRSLNMSGATFRAAIMDFLGTLGWRDIFDLGGVWNRAKRILGEPVSQLISFAGGLVTGILGLIKDAILRPIAALAQGTRGYDLLKAILGRDPITGDPVPRNAETLIGGFMKLIGQEEVWENIKKGNAIPRAWAWFQGALSGLMSQVQAVPGKFMDAITSLTLADIVVLPRAFAKVGGVFLDIIGGFFSWAGGQVMKLLEIVFDVVSPGAMGYIKRVGGSLMSILRNPLPFVGNLVKAAKLGFQNFASRFGTHLKAGLIQWLTGSLPGIYIPTAFTLPELVKFVFSALGLTWANVRAKLVKAVGEPAVKAMETGFDIVVTLVTQGPAAAWEKIKDLLGNLRDMVVGGITDMVVDAVVNKAVPRLVAMFIPGAGFITAILSIYDTVMVFVRQISRIIQVVTGFINSIVAIASGNIAAAATRVEGVLANLLSLAINFLAGFAGLGRVSDKVMAIFNRLRAPIDRALDALITWIVGLARRLGRYVAQAGVPNDPNERVRLASRAAVAAARGLGGRLTGGLLAPALAGIRVRYGLTRIEAYEQNGRWWVRSTINPTDATEVGSAAGAAGGAVDTAKLDRVILGALNRLAQRLYFGWDRDAERRPPPPAAETANVRGAGRARARREAEEAEAARLAGRIPPVPDDPRINAAQRALGGIQREYGRAARVRPGPGSYTKATAPNQFPVLAHTFFVHQVTNNYIVPSQVVTGVEVVNGKFGAIPRDVADAYSYAREVTMERMRIILGILGGGPGQAGRDELAMFLAGMVAEPSRYTISHITNLLALSADHPAGGNAFVHLSMTQGSSDPPWGEDPRADPRLRGVRSPDRDAPRIVTDRDLAIVKGHPALFRQLMERWDPRQPEDGMMVRFQYTIEPYVRRVGR